MKVEDWNYKKEEFNKLTSEQGKKLLESFKKHRVKEDGNSSKFGAFKRQISALEAKNKKSNASISSFRSDDGDGLEDQSSKMHQKMKGSFN